jgi:hypothetical protein
MNWFDILGGVVIILDAISQYKPWKHFQPAHLLLLAGVVTILRAIVADKIPKSRRVVISQEKLFVRTAPFRGLALRWSDIARIDWTASAIVFLVGNRKTRLSLRRAENKAEVIHSILDAAREHGIEIAEST